MHYIYATLPRWQSCKVLATCQRWWLSNGGISYKEMEGKLKATAIVPATDAVQNLWCWRSTILMTMGIGGGGPAARSSHKQAWFLPGTCDNKESDPKRCNLMFSYVSFLVRFIFLFPTHDNELCWSSCGNPPSQGHMARLSRIDERNCDVYVSRASYSNSFRHRHLSGLQTTCKTFRNIPQLTTL